MRSVENLAAPAMTLHIFEHCPYCARTRMIFALKTIPVELSVILEGDAETPIRLVGKKGVPILIKADGTAMSESMEIVRYVDALIGPPVLTEGPREEIDTWVKAANPIISKLAVPRMTRSDFKENSTPASRAAFIARETAAFGDLDQLISDTPMLLAQLNEHLDRLETLLRQPVGFSWTDLVLFSMLRAITIVRDATLPPKSLEFAHYMERVGGVALLTDRAI